MSEPEVIIFTDGACSGNPGPGGWGTILRHTDTGHEKRLSGGEPETTNNRMELRAVIEGLNALSRPCSVRVVTDSKYVSQGMSEWIHAWVKNDWKRGKKPVKNIDLWKPLYELCQKHTVEFQHVFGHAGHPENEECDRMAVAESRRFR